MVALSDIKRLMTPLAGKLKGLVRMARLSGHDSASRETQLGTLAGDADDGVQMLEQHGLASAPPAGSEGISIRVGGERANSVAILFSKRSLRPSDLKSGEVAMYDGKGATILIAENGDIVVTPRLGGVVRLGGTAAVLPVARVTDPVLTPSVALLQSILAAWVPVPGDGGLVLKTALAPFIALLTASRGTITGGGNGSTST